MKRKTIIFSAVFLLFLNICCWKEVFVLRLSRNLQVNFLDVGQGDSAFIETPGGYQILIDGGPGSVLLEKLSSLMPFWDKTIDLVILTHPEADHMQGLLSLLQSYKADYILWTGVKKTDPQYNIWMDILENQNSLAPGAKIIIATKGQEIKAGDVLIDVLFPSESAEGREMKNTSNDTCVVSKIIFGKESFLFTGDISSVAEKNLIAGDLNLKADILKIAHHGSKYSSSESFLAAVSPRIAVISVGAKNSYGHPTGEVLQRLEKFGIKILRTDRDGDIKFVSDGNNLKLLNK